MAFHLAIIGAGGIARAHVAAAQQLDGQVRIRAIVDPRLEAARSLAEPWGAAAFAGVQELLASGAMQNLHGAVVCTPPSARVEIVRACLEARVPLLLEKPVAHHLSEAARLVGLVEANPGVPCMVGFCHRFTPAVDALIDLANTGDLGEIVRLENTFAADLPHLRDHWMSDPAVSGGGAIIDTGVHGIDLFRLLFGDARVEGAVVRHGWPGRGESNATLLLSPTGGDARGGGRIAAGSVVAGVITCGWMENSRFTIDLIGTGGSARYDFDQPEALHLVKRGQAPAMVPVESHEVRFARQLQAFIQTTRGASDRRSCSLDEAVRSLELVFEATSRRTPPATRGGRECLTVAAAGGP